MALEVWSRHGRRLSAIRGSEELRAILEPVLPLGMCVEGEWIKKESCVYLFDLLCIPSKSGIKIEYKWPPVLSKASTGVIDYDPIEWRMESKKNGDRVIIFQQSRDSFSESLIDFSNQERFEKLSGLVKEINNAYVKLIPYTDDDFRGFYIQGKQTGDEGVVMKRRNSPYQAGCGRSIVTESWRKRRYSWD